MENKVDIRNVMVLVAMVLIGFFVGVIGTLLIVKR